MKDGTLTKLIAGREERHFPITNAWIKSNLVKTDCRNCQTETANRTFQTGSITVPAEGDDINLKWWLLYCKSCKFSNARRN